MSLSKQDPCHIITSVTLCCDATGIRATALRLLGSANTILWPSVPESVKAALALQSLASNRLRTHLKTQS